MRTLRALGWIAALLASVWLAGCHICLAKGTLVSTPAGTKPIEDLGLGDAVWTQSPDGRREEGRVTATRAARAGQTIEMLLSDGRRLRATREHPVRIGDAWVRAGEVRPGQCATLETGASPVVVAVRRAGPALVYDLSVAPNECFFAGGVLVHNKTVAAPPRLESLAGPWVGVAYGWLHRLELNQDGTGRAARKVGDTVQRLGVAWKVDGYDVIITLNPLTPASRAYQVRGHAIGQRRWSHWGPILGLESPPGTTAWFVRPDKFTEESDALARAIEAPPEVPAAESPAPR